MPWDCRSFLHLTIDIYSVIASFTHELASVVLLQMANEIASLHTSKYGHELSKAKVTNIVTNIAALRKYDF